MRHADEGTIHAWLDGQIGDPADAAWIERHCQTCGECGARLAGERATLAQAEALLASVAPATETGHPSFEALVARAERPSPSGGAAARSMAQARGRTWQLAAGWAASVALAATLGWMVRDGRLNDEQAPQLALHESSERADAAEAPAGDLTVAAPTLDAAAPAPGEPFTAPADQAEQSRMASAPTVAAARGSDRTTSEPPQRRLADTVPGAAADALTTPAPAAEEPFAATAESAVRSAMPSPAAPPPGVGDNVHLTPAPVPDVIFESPAPRPVAAGAGRGGRGGTSSGGGRAGGPGTTAPTTVETPAARTLAAAPLAAAESAAPAGGRVLVDGMPVNSLTGGTVAQSSAWRQMPRTEAAARTGMALYGITGLTPSMTMLSADGSIVRTIYTTERGEAVELWQQRTPSPEAAGRAIAGSTILSRSADTFNGSWTATYGDVQVTLRGGADVASWGERLRVE